MWPKVVGSCKQFDIKPTFLGLKKTPVTQPLSLEARQE